MTLKEDALHGLLCGAVVGSWAGPRGAVLLGLAGWLLGRSRDRRRTEGERTARPHGGATPDGAARPRAGVPAATSVEKTPLQEGPDCAGGSPSSPVPRVMGKMILMLASYGDEAQPKHCLVFVNDDRKLLKARAAIKSLRKRVPVAEEVVLLEAFGGCGLVVSLGTADAEALPAEVADELFDEHWVEADLPGEEVEFWDGDDAENVRVHVLEDCWYVTAQVDGLRAVSSRVPFGQG